MDPCHEGRVGDKLEGGSVYSLGAPQRLGGQPELHVSKVKTKNPFIKHLQ